MGVRTFAAIDVGSFELSMKIFEFSGKNKMKEIDSITRHLDLGSDTYANAKLSPEKMDELCKSLMEFQKIMKGYKVADYRAYGTSAIRETENTSILQDQITQRTGISIKVLSNSEQRFLDYKSVASRGESFRKMMEEKTAVVDIGGGSIQLSLFDNDALVSTQNVKIGVLRIQELLSHINSSPKKVEELIDELVEARLSVYRKLYLKDREIKNIILLDDYLSCFAIKKYGTKDNVLIGEAELNELLTILRSNNKMDASVLLDVEEKTIPLLLISAVITRRIMQLSGAEQIWITGVSLCDGMAYEYGEDMKLIQVQHDFEKDIIACALNISKRYMGSRKRAETLEHITTIIFDSMKKIHGLGDRERLYLQIASMLHDCGKYISLNNIGETSYDIIMATEMIGLSHKEREIVANVVRFNHSPFLYDEGLRADAKSHLDTQSFLTVAKLTAILRLANSLDRSHKQKLKQLKASLVEDQLILTIDTQLDITLEKGYFDMNKEFFQEVFSVVPVLKTKKNY